MQVNVPILEIKNISKQYPGSNKKANNNISLKIYKGEILCIAGENGAGKTTLMKILMGLEKPDSGEVINKENAAIGMVFQHFNLFPDFTAAVNIVMGNEPLKWKFFFDNKKVREYAQKIIDDNGFSIDSGQRVKDLSLNQKQQTEICRVLYQNAGIIILDEPTSVLTEEETKNLFSTMRRLVKNGKTIIFITHKMREIKEISDRVIVLQEGKVISDLRRRGTGDGGQGFCLETNLEIKSNDNKQENLVPVIEFDNVTVRRRGQMLPLLDNISFSVHAGEILGFTGTGGNGLGVIEAVLSGFLHPETGRVLHNGKDISNFNIRRLRKDGLAFVPSDRKLYGSASGATIEENLIINNRDAFYKGGIFYKKKEAKEFTRNLILKYNILGETGNYAKALSGGNLQKLILAREINSIKDYIVFSEPTWGLDIQASGYIINEIVKLKNKGIAVILISTNSEEVYNLADKVFVMNKGKME